MTLSGQSATTGLIATATATGPAVTWKEKIGGATTTTLLPLATTGFECSGVLGGIGNDCVITPSLGSASIGGAGTAASGTITYGSPTNGDTVTVNGTVFTKAASGGAAAFSTIGELEVLIEALTGINASENGTVITITAASVGTAGNAITLTKTGSALTLSGSTLSGGVNASSLTGGDGKDTEGTTLATFVKGMGLLLQCTAGSFEVISTVLNISLQSNGCALIVTPSGFDVNLLDEITLTALAADTAFKITVLGSIV